MHGKPDAPRADPPRVAMSILNWNGWGDTLECLESVRRLDYGNYLTIVVDNGSRDESVENIRAWAKQKLEGPAAFVEYTRETALRGGEETQEAALDAAASRKRLLLIRNEENLGFTGGNNVSIRYALQRPRAADYVFLLNNDATVEEKCLTHLVAAAQKSVAGIVERCCSMNPAVTPSSTGVSRWSGNSSFPS